jgi:ABC-type uncharacterized transport system ATPase component
VIKVKFEGGTAEERKALAEATLIVLNEEFDNVAGENVEIIEDYGSVRDLR